MIMRADQKEKWGVVAHLSSEGGVSPDQHRYVLVWVESADIREPATARHRIANNG